MTRVIQSWDIRSTSDIRSNWGYRRTGSDMNDYVKSWREVNNNMKVLWLNQYGYQVWGLYVENQ